VRPEFEPRAGFVARAIANLKKNPRHSFDTLMKEGILGRTGEISLYCAEFVHFAFENEVDATSSVRHQSPFHDEIARVSGLGATARANFVALGFDPDGRYFNPGGLLFSKLTRPLFSTFNESTGFFGGGDPNAPEALAWKHMEALSARYNLRFASTFQQFPLKPISLAERMALETAVTLQNVAGVVSQWKRNKQSTGGDDSTTPIGDGNAGGGVELPPGRARYGMMKLANALSGLFKLVDSTVALAPKDAAWREKADHAFETTHLPRMLQLFAVDSK
jgi:hypothetical protein